ncbi:MAG: MoxR family ATPase [Thermoplasmata archaeon]|nr:MoxR family ATPase [Thermoplasmata archaeon]
MDRIIENPADARKVLRDVISEVARAVVGYEQTIFDFMVALSAGEHILLEGVPGIAKTTLAKSVAKAMAIDFGRIQFTQDLLPTDITGHNYYNQLTKKFELRKGPVFTELLLADEINRAPPKTQSALLEAMQEKQVTIEGTTLKLPGIFMVVATLNPIETEGVYPLPEAQIDRFMLKVKMDYPDEDEELTILSLKNLFEEEPEPVMTRENVLQLRKLCFDVYAHRSILTYINEVTRATRTRENVELGLSPRGGIHLLASSKGRALLSGRSYVIPDDVKAVAHAVIDHRLMLSPEAELEGLTAGSITDSILSEAPVPKGDFGENKMR